MLIFRYFIYVGGALLALLFGVNLVLLEPADVHLVTVASSGDSPLIRIRSDRKLPERVVIDTSQPIIVPAAKTAAVVAPQPQVPVEASPVLAEMSAKARLRETFAQFVPPEPKVDASSLQKIEAKLPPPRKRKVAKIRTAPPPGRPLMLVAQQRHSGFFNALW